MNAPPVLRFEAMGGNALPRLDAEVRAGQMARIVCADEEPRDELWDVLTGQRRPSQGRLWYAGQDLYSLPPVRRLTMFQRIAVVPGGGGLISNLRAWENIVLSAAYHRGRSVAELEQPVAQWLAEFGLDQARMRALTGRLPEQLHASERIVVALVRALLMEPDIILYGAPFSGIDRDTAARLLQVATHYHRADAGRVALWLLPDEPFSARVPADVTLEI